MTTNTQGKTKTINDVIKFYRESFLKEGITLRTDRKKISIDFEKEKEKIMTEILEEEQFYQVRIIFTNMRHRTDVICQDLIKSIQSVLQFWKEYASVSSNKPVLFVVPEKIVHEFYHYMTYHMGSKDSYQLLPFLHDRTLPSVVAFSDSKEIISHLLHVLGEHKRFLALLKESLKEYNVVQEIFPANEDVRKSEHCSFVLKHQDSSIDFHIEMKNDTFYLFAGKEERMSWSHATDDAELEKGIHEVLEAIQSSQVGNDIYEEWKQISYQMDIYRHYRFSQLRKDTEQLALYNEMRKFASAKEVKSLFLQSIHSDNSEAHSYTFGFSKFLILQTLDRYFLLDVNLEKIRNKGIDAVSSYSAATEKEIKTIMKKKVDAMFKEISF